MRIHGDEARPVSRLGTADLTGVPADRSVNFSPGAEPPLLVPGDPVDHRVTAGGVEYANTVIGTMGLTVTFR